MGGGRRLHYPGILSAPNIAYILWVSPSTFAEVTSTLITSDDDPNILSKSMRFFSFFFCFSIYTPQRLPNTRARRGLSVSSQEPGLGARIACLRYNYRPDNNTEVHFFAPLIVQMPQDDCVIRSTT